MKQRSPFGELVRRHRRHLGLSQEALARTINQLVEAGDAGIEGRISPKTIYNHEAEWDDPARFAVPRVGTIGVYADAFGLPRGSAERQQLVDAAEETRRLRDATATSNATPPPLVAPAPATRFAASPGFAVAGREHAWQALQHALAAAAAGQPQVAFIEGEAGIGKTRLLRELARQAGYADERLTVAWGRSIAPSPAPYHAARELIASLAGDVQNAGITRLVSAEMVERIRRRAPDAIAALLRDAPAAIGPLVSSDLLHAQAAALQLDGDPWDRLFARLAARQTTVEPGTLHAQIATMLCRYAATGPLVLVVDDLHWATPGTVQLLTLLVRVLRDTGGLPLLLLGAFRPEAASRPPDSGPAALGDVLAEIQRAWPEGLIDLAPAVDPVHGRAYIDGRLDLTPNRLDATFRDTLHVRTGGLPIFVENALWALRTNGLLTPDADGALTFQGQPDDLALPPSTAALIGQRFAGLDETARQALEIAAVQGTHFFSEPVVATMGLASTVASHLLDDDLTAQAHLIVPAGTVTVAGKRLHRYEFAHALYRDYLFDHLGTLRREQLQAATAQALDELVGASHTALSATIADLYEQGGEFPLAARHHRLAGVHDLDLRNPASAADHFARAIAFADHQTQAWEIGQAMLGVIRGLRMTGESRRAIAECQRAIAFSHARQVPDIEVFALIWLGLLSYDLGALHEAEGYFRRALPPLRELGDATEEARTEGLLAHVLYGLGRYEEAMAHADRALELADGVRDDSLAAESRLAAANCLLDLGRYQEAIATFEEAIARYGRAQEVEGAAMCRADIGLCLIGLERWPEAVLALRDARASAHRLAAARLLGHVELYQGLADEGLGDPAQAGKAYASSLRLRRRAGQIGYAVDALAGELRVNLATGRLWFARRLLWGIGQHLELRGAEGIEEPFRVAESCLAALDVLDRPDEARRLLGASVGLLRERAESIASPAWRASYLAKVPANRALLRRAGRGAPEEAALQRSDVAAEASATGTA